MSVIGQVEQTAISSLVDLLGHGDIFPRVISEIERANESMPNATGADKRHKVLADFEIIFNDLIEPVGESVLRMLLELGVAWIQHQGK